MSEFNLSPGFLFVVAVIALLILISIQYTLNLILRELREIRRRMRYDKSPGEEKVREHE